ANTTMHYNHLRQDERLPAYRRHAALQHAARRPPPASVQQRHHALVGSDQVDRDAVGDGHGQEHAGCSRRVTILAVEDQPARLSRTVPLHGGAVDLVAQHDRRKRGLRSEEHTSELQSLAYLVCRLLLEKKNTKSIVMKWVMRT